MNTALVPPAFPPLPAELSIYTVTDVRAEWLDWVGAHADALRQAASAPRVDGAAVDIVDGAGLQLLMSLARTWREAGLALCVERASQPLREACVALGVSALLEVDGGQAAA